MPAVDAGTLVERFEMWTAQSPDAVAVICGDLRLAYGDMNAAADRTAADLLANGVWPDSTVVLCVPRGTGFAVALLGVLKAGATYVALEAGKSADRRKLWADDAQVVCAVTESGREEGWRVPVLGLADLAGAGAPSPVAEQDRTGRAVVMERGPITSLVNWAVRRYGFADRSLQYFPVTSELAAVEFLAAWWTGGCAVVATEAERADPAALSALIGRHEVRTALLPAPCVAELSRASVEELGSLRAVVAVGQLTPDGEQSLSDLASRLPGMTPHLLWAATGAGIVTAQQEHTGTVSVGSPTAGARVYVLDERLRPTPINVPGDVYVGGSGLARGYVGTTDLTADAFVPDPLASVPGARMYRTGERGRWRRDGTVELVAQVRPAAPDAAPAGRGEPRDDIERRLLRIWQEVLDRREFGTGDDFFALGGRPPSALEAQDRAGRAFGVTLPPDAIATHPTVAELAELVADALAARRPALVAELDQPPVLSFTQERLWFLDQLQPNISAYMVPGVWRLRGPLDHGALARAFRLVVARHTVLRTRVTDVDGELRATVEPADTAPFDVFDLTGEADPERAVDERMTAAVPYDMERDPTAKALLFMLSDDDHVLQLVIHHAAFDGGSGRLLLHELSAGYAAYAASIEPDLPELTVQYRDFAAWQRRTLAGPVATEQADYWRATLAGAPPALELPVDHPRPPVQSYRGGEVRFTVEADVARRLRAIADDAGATPYMVLLAGYQVLLSRYGRVRDVVVGSPANGRNLPPLEPLIGPFVNSVALRARIDDDLSFRVFLHQVRDTTLDAAAHQELPFERMVEEVAPARDLSRTPIFQAWFQFFERADLGGLRLPGITATDFSDLPPSVRFDVVMHLEATDDARFAGSVVYALDLFDESSMRRFAQHYGNVLTAIAADPGQRLSALPLADDAEVDQVLHGWNDTSADLDLAPGTVIDRFEAQAAATPDAVALVCGAERLSFAELNTRANQVAWQLRAHGVPTGSIVGLLLPRNVELIVGLLGIMKTGGAYLPVDLEHPPDRIAYMLHTAGVTLAVTDEQLARALPAGTTTVLLPVRPGRPTGNPPRTTGVDDLVYVIYTSGSTGRPKGVAMTNRPLLNLLRWQVERSAVAGPTLQYSAIAFDISFQEVFSTWLGGSAVVLLSDDQRIDPHQVLGTMRGAGCTRLFCPPLVVEHLARAAAEHAELPPLKEITTAGEPLHLTEEIRGLLARLPGVRLDNQYGPTEAHVITAGELTGDSADWPADPPIGRPIANTRVYLLDERMHPVPVGVPGELYVGGGCLALGYVGKPDLTADRFVPDPFGAATGDRLYRTGDLAVHGDGGTLRFLGRVDDQVKVRGYRVEPGEIETLLAGHPAVGKAVVTAYQTDAGLRLAAYLIPASPEPSPSVAGLRKWLEDRVPEYMVPAAFVWLDILPTTPVGKVDRKALPAPSADPAEHVPPRNPVDQTIVTVWQDVLDRPGIGIRDNFFDLGGHSLLIPQIVFRLNEEFGVELPLRALFGSQTVMELADEVAELVATDKE